MDMQVHRMLNQEAKPEENDKVTEPEQKPVIEIRNDTKDKVDNLLVNSKTDKVRYFLKEFFRKEL